jgi:hypothetical protein
MVSVWVLVRRAVPGGDDGAVEGGRMTQQAKAFWQGFLRISLWVASIGLMISSSGLDGAYLAKLMPPGWGLLGLVLNTVADVTSELGMYWYGRLQMDKSSTKRKKAKWLLAGQVILVGYAWLFSWRQLVPIIAQVDPDAPWMAFIGAAFIPSALLVVGYVQALLAGRIENEKVDAAMESSAVQVEPEPAPVAVTEKWGTARKADFERVRGKWNGNGEMNEEQLESELAADKLLMPSRSTVRRWLKLTRKVETK